MHEESCLIDGFGPVPFVRPETVAALGEVVRQTRNDGTALYPIGGRTMLNLGMPPTQQGRAVDMRGLNQVIDFPARDMTITVQAGILMAQLRQILAKENLRLPIDVPLAEQATLGGSVAANVSGSRRYGFGTLRDYLIGIGAINDMGEEFKAGGRVVKNVAGYDLCKLLIGSLGTLGIITQITLKLRPMVEEQALVTLACENESLETVLNQLHGSRTRPVCLELLNRSAAKEIFGQARLPSPRGAWVVVIGFEGNAEVVQWQVQQLVREIGGGGYLEALVGFTTEPLWNALTEWDLWTAAYLTFKANMLPSAVAGFCQAVSSFTLADAPGSEGLWLRAHAGNGIVKGHLPDQILKEQAANELFAWRDLACRGHGNVVVSRCPADWKDTLSVWGPAPAEAWLMREIKTKFDPRRIFNPGRFVDGI